MLRIKARGKHLLSTVSERRVKDIGWRVYDESTLATLMRWRRMLPYYTAGQEDWQGRQRQLDSSSWTSPYLGHFKRKPSARIYHYTRD